MPVTDPLADAIANAARHRATFDPAVFDAALADLAATVDAARSAREPEPCRFVCSVCTFEDDDVASAAAHEADLGHGIVDGAA